MSERDITPPKMPQLKISPSIIGIVVVVFILAGVGLTSFFMVDQTEQAVVLRFGKFERIVGPGLQFKIPLGIEQNFNVPTQRVQNKTFGFRTQQPGVTTAYVRGDFPEESIMLTGDLNIIDVEWIIQYRISNAVKWLFNVEHQQKTLRDISQSVINQLVGDRAILDVIGPERTNIEYQAQQKMQDVFDHYELGVTMTTVRLQNIVPPKGEVQDAFEDVNKAIQDLNRLIDEGQEAYNREIPRTRGEAEKTIQFAQGYATERINEARGNVARFNAVYREYSQSPNITRRRLYIETVQEIFSEKEGTYLIDKSLSNLLPLLNLQEGLTGTGMTGGSE